jgi:hypothetical protein
MPSFPSPEKLYLRFSTAADLDRVVEFYEQHRSPYVFQREREVWKERVEAGAVTLIENAKGDIVASTISYPLRAGSGAGQYDAGDQGHRWTEIGSVRVALEGIGLFRPLIAAQVLRAAAYEPPEDGFVLEIVNANTRSREAFAKIGAAPFTLPGELFEQVQQTFAEGKDREVGWYRIAPETYPVFAAEIASASGRRLGNAAAGQHYVLDTSRLLLEDLVRDVSAHHAPESRSQRARGPVPKR